MHMPRATLTWSVPKPKLFTYPRTASPERSTLAGEEWMDKTALNCGVKSLPFIQWGAIDDSVSR